MRPVLAPRARLGLRLLGAAAVLAPVVAVGVVTAQDRADQRALDRARTVALALEPPAGGREATTCRSDGLVACWHVGRPVAEVAQGVGTALSGSALQASTTSCDTVPVGTTGPRLGSESCFVRVRFDDRGVFVFLDPLVERDAAGVATVVGSVVRVSAS